MLCNLLIRLTSKIISKNAWDNQLEAWNNGLTYPGNKPANHKKGIEKLYRMIGDAKCLALKEDREELSKKAICKLVVKALHPDTQISVVQKGIKQMKKEEDILSQRRREKS